MEPRPLLGRSWTPQSPHSSPPLLSCPLHTPHTYITDLAFGHNWVYNSKSKLIEILDDWNLSLELLGKWCLKWWPQLWFSFTDLSKAQTEQKGTTLKTNAHIWGSNQGQNREDAKSTDKEAKRGNGGVTRYRLIWLVQELFGEPNYVLGFPLCKVFQDPEMGNVAFKGVMPSPTLHKAFPPSLFVSFEMWECKPSRLN